jgi:ankyrin repeat protein
MSLSPRLLASLLLTAACAGPAVDRVEPTDTARAALAHGEGSCRHHCNAQSGGSCWCDALCVQYGDCCEDVATHCYEVVCPPMIPTAGGGDARSRLEAAFTFDKPEWAADGMAALEAFDRRLCFRHISWARVLWAASTSPLGPDYVGRLVRAGIDPNLSDMELDPLCEGCTGHRTGKGALHFATASHDGVGHGHPVPVMADFATRVTIVERLLDAGADPDQVSAASLFAGGNQVGSGRVGGATPLMLAARWIDEPAARAVTDLLLARGADLDARCYHVTDADHDGWILAGETAFEAARRSDREAHAAYLRSLGAIEYDLEAEQAASRATTAAELPPILASSAVTHDRIWTLAFRPHDPLPPVPELLAGGLAPNVRLWGSKMVPYAGSLFDALVAVLAPVAHFEALVDAGADIHAPSELGLTPLLAVVNGYYDSSAIDRRVQVARLLLDRGVAVDARAPDGDTALLRTMYVGARLDLTQLFLERGADPNAANDAGSRPVSVAVKAAAQLAVLDALLAHGADLNAIVGGLPLWAYSLRHNPTNVVKERLDEVQALLDRIVHHPSLVIDLGAPGVAQALAEAAANALVKPYVDVIHARATGSQ